MLDSDEEEKAMPSHPEVVENKVRLLLDSGISEGDILTLPANLGAMPRIAAIFKQALLGLKLTVIEDKSLDCKKLPLLDFWSEDESKIQEVIKLLKGSNVPLLNALSTLNGYLVGTMVMPNESSVTSTPYGKGQAWIGVSAVLVYQELHFSRRMSDIRSMIQNYEQLKRNFEDASSLYGATAGSELKRILSAAEMLLKHHLRTLLNTECKKKEEYLKGLGSLSRALMAAPTSMIDLNCRTAVEEKTVRKGRSSEKVRRTRVLRPALLAEGVPLHPEEASIAHTINVAIGIAVPTVIKTMVRQDDLGLIQGQIRSVLGSIYARTDAVNALLKERKRIVRNAII